MRKGVEELMYFDIGANIGDWALANINNCNKIIAVEASPSTYIKLENKCKNEIFKSPYSCGKMPYRDELLNYETTYIEDITSERDPIRLIRKYYTRCCDSFLWNYTGIIKFLNHMNEDKNYGAPFDYYMTNKMEIDKDFKHYWSTVPFFIQGSNHGHMKSTIQYDVV